MPVRRDNNVRNEVIVSMKDPFRVAVRILVSSKLPYDDGLIYENDLATWGQLSNNNIPREAVKIISGFSDDVAIAVTHPLWPGKEPRYLN